MWVRGDFDPKQILSTTPWAVDRTWTAGTPDRKHVAEDSGFSVVVSEADFDQFQKQVQDAVSFIRAEVSELARLRASPGVRVITFNFGVAQRDQPAWSLSFPPELIELAGKLRIEIEVTLYAVTGVGGFEKM
jgi:hypothetical protein